MLLLQLGTVFPGNIILTNCDLLSPLPRSLYLEDQPAEVAVIQATPGTPLGQRLGCLVTLSLRSLTLQSKHFAEAGALLAKLSYFQACLSPFYLMTQICGGVQAGGGKPLETSLWSTVMVPSVITKLLIFPRRACFALLLCFAFPTKTKQSTLSKFCTTIRNSLFSASVW